LFQISVSDGGMPKLPIESVEVTAEGVAGDWQKNRKYHGGPDRAVCLFSVELYDWLRTRDIDLPAGSVGENFTTAGIDLNGLKVGDRFRVGHKLVIELTDIREPCRNLNKLHPELLQRMKGRSGWVAKVVTPGTVKTGDTIEQSK